MPILKIVTYGNPVLTKRAEHVKEIDEEIRKLAHDMVLTMHAAPGVGLAAPQVSVSRRLITVDLSVGERPDELHVLVNPEIVEKEGEAYVRRGLPLGPGIEEKVRRPAKVRVRGLDLEGREKELMADGNPGQGLLPRDRPHRRPAVHRKPDAPQEGSGQKEAQEAARVRLTR